MPKLSCRTPIPLPILTSEEIDRFRQKYTQRGPDECWPWHGAANSKGYGHTSVRRNGIRITFSATRMAWVLAGNSDPGEKLMLHGCNNPSCVNPNSNRKHLFPDTQKANLDQMMREGRGNKAFGERHGNSLWTDPEIVEMRVLYSNGATYTEIAKQFPMDITNVALIVTGRRRLSAGGPIGVPARKRL